MNHQKLFILNIKKPLEWKILEKQLLLCLSCCQCLTYCYSVTQMQDEINKGKAPKDVESVHNKHMNVDHSKPHVHFKDRTSLNSEGTVHDKVNGTSFLSRK